MAGLGYGGMYDSSTSNFYLILTLIFFNFDYIRLVLNGQLTGGELISFCLFAQGVTIGNHQSHIDYPNKNEYVFSQ
jgi:hypothetical protein